MPGADSVSGLPNRGYTYFGDKTPPTTYGQSVGVEGTPKTFNNDAAATNGGVITPRDNRKIECLLVRNASGISLLPGRVCTWQATYEGRRVDGMCRLDWSGPIAGVVDDLLPTAGVQKDDLFWLMIKGPALVKTSLGADATNVINENDFVMALTAATSQATTSGRIQSYVATSNVTNAVTALLNKIGQAMSAKTTGNTNANVLINLQLMP